MVLKNKEEKLIRKSPKMPINPRFKANQINSFRPKENIVQAKNFGVQLYEERVKLIQLITLAENKL